MKSNAPQFLRKFFGKNDNGKQDRPSLQFEGGEEEKEPSVTKQEAPSTKQGSF